MLQIETLSFTLHHINSEQIIMIYRNENNRL